MKEMELKMLPKQQKRDYHGVMKAITWPWKRKDIANALEVIERQKTLIMLALQGGTSRAILEVETSVKEVETSVQDIRVLLEKQIHKSILRWLNKPDPVMNHAAARKKHEPRTGE
jgi:hypothetical protein